MTTKRTHQQPDANSDPADLGQRVTDWLSTQGYRIEYLTHKALKDAGLNATMSYYLTSAEGKMREIDVAGFCADIAPSRQIILRLLCECKYSQDSPWVIMTSDLSSHLDIDWLAMPASRNTRERLGNINGYSARLKSCWHFADGHLFGHSLVQSLRTNNRDAAFESLQKISHAAWGLR